MTASLRGRAIAVLVYFGIVETRAGRSSRRPARRHRGRSRLADAVLAWLVVGVCLAAAAALRPALNEPVASAVSRDAPSPLLAETSPFITPAGPTRGELDVIVDALQSDASRMVARRPADAPAFDALIPAGARVEVGGAHPLMRVDDDPAHLRLSITIVGSTGERTPVLLDLRYEDRWLVNAVILGGAQPTREPLEWA